jgi:hypothetical protein
MTEAQEAHLGSIKAEFVRMADVKYRKGQEEHGGNLFDVPVRRLIDFAIEEAIDQVVYLITIRESL